MEKIFKGLIRINETKWELPATFKEGMLVKGVIYADESIIGSVDERSIEQLANVAMLKGIVKASLGMPDIHTGYGFPIGGVAAVSLDGVVSPGGVGYDINCGVRLLKTNLTKEEVIPGIKDLIEVLYKQIPAGVGSKGKIGFDRSDLDGIVCKGVNFAIEKGFGDKKDSEKIESNGFIKDVDPALISSRAYIRGLDQIGTLGSGNHFIEVQYVDDIFDETAAKKLGLFKGQVTIMIHCGSRGFGHQVCTDYLAIMEEMVKKYNMFIPDKELSSAPLDSKEAKNYLKAMNGAANYAWVNRQFLQYLAKEALTGFFGNIKDHLEIELVYDVSHNIAKFEDHIVDGKKMKLLVHRKGATRAFMKGHPDLPEIYKDTGQPVLIPGDMGRASFVLVGTEKAMEETFGSTCHGAGRILSRNKAIKEAKGRSIKKELEEKGVIVKSSGRETLAEEMPEAYKDISNVVEVVHKSGLSKKVAKLRPIGVIKG